MKNILLEDNLKINENKTEHTTYERKNKSNEYTCEQVDDLKLCIKRHELENWRTVKKLGSLLGDHEDIERRKQLSIAALHKMNNVWIRKDKIRQEMRIK